MIFVSLQKLLPLVINPLELFLKKVLQTFDNSKYNKDLIYHQLQRAIKQHSVERENILWFDMNEVCETAQT